MAKGFPPTRAEISEHFGWTSPNAAQSHLNALQRKGCIRIERGHSRGIRVIPTTTETLRLPERTAIQLQAIEVRKIWDTEGCHSARFPEALTTLFDMVLS